MKLLFQIYVLLAAGLRVGDAFPFPLFSLFCTPCLAGRLDIALAFAFPLRLAFKFVAGCFFTLGALFRGRRNTLCSQMLTLTLTLSLSLAHSLTLSLSLSHSHAHTHTHSHSHSQSHSHSPSLSISHSLTLSRSRSLSLSLHRHHHHDLHLHHHHHLSGPRCV